MSSALYKGELVSGDRYTSNRQILRDTERDRSTERSREI
jgi:hypothetical protein